MSYLHDISNDKEKLLNQIKYLEENEKIDNEIKESRCPVCGGKVEYIMRPGGGDSIVIPYIGIVKCTCCNMFKKEVKRNIQQSYHWTHDGSDEIALKRDTWNSVRCFVKMEK